jgi:hypothetical protein
MRAEDTYEEDNSRLEKGWRNFLASLLVDARNEIGWLSQTLTSENVVFATRRDGFSRHRLVCAASHWRWVFESTPCSLPFSYCCEELGLDEMSARNRIIAHCSENRDINRLVRLVLSLEKD